MNEGGIALSKIIFRKQILQL